MLCRHVKRLVWRTPHPSRLTDVNEVVDGPHKWTFGDRESFCNLVGPKSGTSTVALVGNGPLDRDQRLAIASADLIVRFNAMNNRQDKFSAEVLVLELYRALADTYSGARAYMYGYTHAPACAPTHAF